MPVVEARQRAVTSAPRRRPGTPAKMSDQTIQRLKPLLDQSSSSFHAQAFVALVRAEVMRLLPVNPQGFDINIRGRLDKANSNHTLQVQYNPHANDWNAIVNNLTRWLRQHTSNRKAYIRMDRIRMSPTNDRFWVQVSLPLQENSMATAKKRAPSKPNLMDKVKGGKPGIRRKVAASSKPSHIGIKASTHVKNAAEQALLAIQLAATDIGEEESVKLRVTFRLNPGGETDTRVLDLREDQVDEWFAALKPMVMKHIRSFAQDAVRHEPGGNEVTIFVDSSAGSHVIARIDPDRFNSD